MDEGSPVIYLDLDGTLVDVQERYCRLHADTARELGRRPLPRARFWALKRQGASLETLLNHWDEPVREAYSRRWLAAIEAPSYTRFDRLIPAAREALATLAQRFRLVLVTLRRDERGLRQQLRQLGVDGFFAGLVAAADHPAGDYTKAQLLRLGASTNGGRGIVVGDSEADVEAAREMGLPVVCVLTGIRDRRFLQALNPDYIVESVGRLPELLKDIAWTKRLAV